MSSEIKKTSNGLDSSLDFQKEFTYIHLGRQDPSQDTQRLQLKLLSKISKPLPNPSRPTHRKPLAPRSPSQERRKTKTRDKSLSKRKLHDRDLSTKPLPTRRDYKTLQPKSNENRPRGPPKTCRQPLNKNPPADTSKRFPKKKKTKEAALTPAQKETQWTKGKGLPPKKLTKVRSERGLQYPLASEMSRQAKRGQREQKVMQEYFGMTQKLSSILQEKSSARLQREKSKLSKCKTHSSSSSLRFAKPKTKR